MRSQPHQRFEVVSFSIALVLACTIFVSRAGAQSGSDEEARIHFEAGRAHYDRGDYEAALREFESALELSGRVPLIYNIYLVLERLGRHAEAADRLEEYLSRETSLDETTRANYRSRIQHLRERAASETARDSAPSPEQSAAPSPPAGGGLGEPGVAGLIALGAGGASLVAMGIVGGLAASEDSALANRCGENAGRTCTDADVSTLRTLTGAADALLAVGLVLVAAGGTMVAIEVASSGERSADGSARVSLTPALSPFCAGLTVGVTL